MTFNTLDAVRRIEAAGLERPKAEAIVDEIAASRDDLFTKADGAALEARLDAKLDARFAIQESRFDAKLAAVEKNLEIAKVQMIWAIFAVVGFADSLLFFALKR